MDVADPDFRVLLIGAGRLGSAILRGWRRNGAPPDERILVRVRGENTTGLTAASDEACARATVVVLAVKPKDIAAAGAVYDGLLAADTIVISVAAGVSAASVSGAFGGRRVARVMPTTAVAIGRGTATVFAEDDTARALATALFAPVAEVVQLADEGLMDAATAVSGSGPAYLYAFVESLAAAGVAAGLPQATAARLARSTVAGAAAMMAISDESPADLKAQVASPGGTTEAALRVLEPGLEPLLNLAVAAARARAGALAGG